MNKEQKIEIAVIIVALLALAAVFAVGFIFGYYVLAYICVFLLFFSIYLWFKIYLRIQHNIDRSIDRSYFIANEIGELKATLIDKIKTDKDFYLESADFFEDFINELEIIKKQKEELGVLKEEIRLIAEKNAEKVVKSNIELASTASLSFSKLQEEMLQTEKEIIELQKKAIILAIQSMEYQKDQTDFLKEEIKKNKNAPN